jgi:hypothetical protein
VCVCLMRCLTVAQSLQLHARPPQDKSFVLYTARFSPFLWPSQGAVPLHADRMTDRRKVVKRISAHGATLSKDPRSWSHSAIPWQLTEGSVSCLWPPNSFARLRTSPVLGLSLWGSPGVACVWFKFRAKASPVALRKGRTACSSGGTDGRTESSSRSMARILELLSCLTLTLYPLLRLRDSSH